MYAGCELGNTDSSGLSHRTIPGLLSHVLFFLSCGTYFNWLVSLVVLSAVNKISSLARLGLFHLVCEYILLREFSLTLKSSIKRRVRLAKE